MILPCEKPDLYRYTPHQGRMLLLDRVLSYDLDSISVLTEVDVHSQAEFFDQEIQGIPIWISFEYMAQSIAVLSGIKQIAQGVKKPKLGFIMSVRNFHSQQDLFSCGDVVQTQMKEILYDDVQKVGVYEGSTFVGEKLSSRATLSLIRDVDSLLPETNESEK